ncbi:MAG: hypothetical protein WA087_03990 [Candidatus Saccharimonadales bacterium]
MKKIKYILLTLGIVIGFSSVMLPTTAGAADLFDCAKNPTSAICKNSPTMSNYIKTIVNTLLFVLGSVAVITIIIAGIRYSTSHGEPKAVQVAKDTLLYAVIGLVVAISAYAIVNFVVLKFFIK